MASCKPAYLAAASILLLNACTIEPVSRPEIHGHRGCRGLLPENTVPAFLKAEELGCDWLEMDVVITGDSQVLVSHEPWMEQRICRTPSGDSITELQAREYNIFRMTVEEVQRFDCGSAEHPDFPDQEHQRLHKPTLREVVEAVNDRTMMNGGMEIGYNIEIKSDPLLYDTYQPRPDRFVELVLAQLDDLGIAGRTIIQSFDPAVLEAIHRMDEDIPVALLVENRNGLEANLKRLSFTPAYYSPSFELVNKDLVRALDERDIQLLVWTVNRKSDIKKMLKLGVGGIITDYPGKVIELVEEQ